MIIWSTNYSGNWWGATGLFYQVGTLGGYHGSYLSDLYDLWSMLWMSILNGSTMGFLILGCLIALISCGRAKSREARSRVIGGGLKNSFKVSIGLMSSGATILLVYSLSTIVSMEALNLSPFFILPAMAYQIYLLREDSQAKDPWNQWLLFSIIEVAVIFAVPYLVSWRYDELQAQALFYMIPPSYSHYYYSPPLYGLLILFECVIGIGSIGMFAGPVMGIVTSVVTKRRADGGANIGAGTRNTAKVGIILQLGSGVFWLVVFILGLFSSGYSMKVLCLYPLCIIPIVLIHAYFTFEHPKFKATDFQKDRLKSGTEISTSRSRPPEPTQTKSPVPESIVTTPPPPPSNIKVCPACNASLPVNAKFCNKCGKTL